jgi:uncharacterized protein (DUF1778 family)
MRKTELFPTSIRLTPKQRVKLEKAAEARGMLLTAFIRHAACIVADEPVRRESRRGPA